MRRNGVAAAHAVVTLPPALARRVPEWEPGPHEVVCSACLDHFDGRAEGDPGGTRPWDPIPLCERCMLTQRCA